MLGVGGVKSFQVDSREAAQTAASFRMVIADWLAFHVETFFTQVTLVPGFRAGTI